MDFSYNHGDWSTVCYLIFAFCSALFLGALKGFLVGPIAGLILIIGNVGVIFGLFPSHVVWTVYTLFKIKLLDEPLKVAILLALPALFGIWLGLSIGVTVLVGPIAGLILIIGNVGVIFGLFPSHVVWTVYTLFKIKLLDEPLKVAILLALPALFGIWLGLSIGVTVLVGFGYGFFTPWVSTFEAFRHENESNKFLHCLVNGTWDTIKGSCTVVRDFADLCYHSYPIYLKELRDYPCSNEVLQPLRLIHVPGCIIAGLIGLIVEVPLYTAIAVVKSPYMLFRGWFRLIHDLVTREGPFLETVCIPIAGLTILMWPIIVILSVSLAILSSVFVGLYASVVVYQERSFRRGLAYVVAMVAEFDEYTNDWLYLHEGTLFPRPQYRKDAEARLPESSPVREGGPGEAPAMLVPSLARSRSFKQTIQEVKMVQIWGNVMRSCEIRGKELIDKEVLTAGDLFEWMKEGAGIVDVGLPCYALLVSLVHSIKAKSFGVLLLDGVEVTHLNRPKDKLLDWFFNPVMVLKEQIRALGLGEGEVRFLEKVVLFGADTKRIQAWENGSLVPHTALRAAQFQGISRRMAGMVRSVSKFPTYRRMFRQVVKDLVTYSIEKEDSTKSNSVRSNGNSIDSVV